MGNQKVAKIPDVNRSFLYKLRMKQITKREKVKREKRRADRTIRAALIEPVELSTEEVQEIERMNLSPVDEFEAFVDLYKSKMENQE